MRWWSIPILLALGWFTFTLTPFWALYGLAGAVAAGDAGYIERHVNFRTLRLSLVRQSAAAVRTGEDAAPGGEPRGRQRLAEAAVALAVPLAETLVTPQTVIDLLDDGWPQSFDARPDVSARGADAASASAPGLRIDRLSRLLPYYLQSEMRGFRTVVIGVPPDAPRAQQFRVRLRLRGWVWRLVDIELTEELRDRIAQKLAQSGSLKLKDPKAPGAPSSPGAP